MLDVSCQSERNWECSEKIVNLDRSRLFRTVKLYSLQREGNKDCEVHRCVDFFQHGHIFPIDNWTVFLKKVGKQLGTENHNSK